MARSSVWSGVKRKTQHIPTNVQGDEPMGTGILADFIARMKDEGCTDEVDPLAFSLVMSEVSRETLYCKIMDLLTAFWKKKKHPQWEFPGRAALLQRCLDIAKDKRQAACLRSAVENECMMRQLLKKPAFHRDETFDERRQRVEGFWEHYSSREADHSRERSSEEWRNRQRPALRASTVVAELGPRESTAAQRAAVVPDLGTHPQRPSCGSVESRNSAARRLLGEPHRPSSTLQDHLGRRVPSLPEEPPHLLPSASGSSIAASTVSGFADKVLGLPRRLLSSKTSSKCSRSGTRPGTNPARRRKVPCVEELEDILPSKPSSVLPELALRPGTTNGLPSNPARPGTTSKRVGQSRPGSTAEPRGVSSRITPSSSALPSQTSSTTSLASSRLELPPLKYEPPALGTAFMLPESPRMQYLKTCQLQGIAPMSIPFTTGHSSKFTVSQWALRDRQLLPIIDMAKEMPRVEEVDLSHNTQLTDRALAPFIDTVCRKQPPTLLRLSLSRCNRVGLDTLNTIVDCLWQQNGGLQSLRELDLSGIHIPIKCYIPLSGALGKHRNLKELCLTDTGLGSWASGQACKVIEDLLSSQSLEELDIGWSMLGKDVFTQLGSCLSRSRCLRILSVPNCSATSVTRRDFPVEYFLERLGKAETLTRLDVSLNHIDYRGALIMEDALERHRNLKELIIVENHLGVAGIRSLLRVLARDGSGLVRLEFEGCATGSMSTADLDSQQAWTMTNPGGRYSFDLARPYHRAFVRMLYKTCESFKFEPSSAFTDIVYHPAPYKHPQKDDTGTFMVPSQGKLTMTFTILQGVGQDAAAMNDLWDFTSFLERRVASHRLQPSFNKIVPLFANWKTVKQRSEKMAMLDAIASDFLLTFPQLQELGLQSNDYLNEVLIHTMHCLRGGQPARYLSMLLTPSIGHYMHNYACLRNLFGFNPENPTWHYRLELDNHADHHIAQNLLLLDRWEVEVERHLQRADVSQCGNRSHVRNMEYQGRPLQVSSAAEWVMPAHDLFEFDYVSGKRPPTDVEALDDYSLNKILQLLEQNDLDSKVQIDVLKQIASHVLLRSLQLRELLGVFWCDAQRADIFALFYFRITDMHNEKVFRVRFDSTTELERLRKRLGYATFFPFIQPEHATFNLNFAYHDQRLAANFIFMLMVKEQVTNVKNPVLYREDGTIEPLPQGIPRSWESFERMPKSGTFSAVYCSAPEDRHFDTRKRLFERYGHWKCSVSEQDVLWWSALTEAPDDVNEFMEYLVCNYKDPSEAFSIFDGVDGNGIISLSEFQEALQELNCKKFAGPDEAQRIREVFRYLDPSGEGGVSPGEWQILDQLWNEMIVSLEEFVKFLGRAFFYHSDFLKKAWDTLDQDGSGEIEREEWSEVVRQTLKYFGPADVIFNFLDKDDEGTLSFDEFKALQGFVDAQDIAQKRESHLAARQTRFPSFPVLHRRASGELPPRLSKVFEKELSLNVIENIPTTHDMPGRLSTVAVTFTEGDEDDASFTSD